jgi:bifunctional DNase/RNase
MLDMKVKRLTVDPLTNLPVLILTDESGGTSVPITIGVIEASAIASELAQIELQRPQAHDLMKSILGECGARVVRVELRDVRRATFYASIFLERPGEAPRATRRAGAVQPIPVPTSVIEIDARPSDAIALALRTGAPIRVSRKVIEKSQPLLDPDVVACGGEPTDEAAPAGGPEDDGLGLPLLESLPDEDFGKWKM